MFRFCYIYIYIYIYIKICTYIHIYIYTYIHQLEQRNLHSEGEGEGVPGVAANRQGKAGADAYALTQLERTASTCMSAQTASRTRHAPSEVVQHDGCAYTHTLRAPAATRQWDSLPVHACDVRVEEGASQHSAAVPAVSAVVVASGLACVFVASPEPGQTNEAPQVPGLPAFASAEHKATTWYRIPVTMETILSNKMS